MDTSPFAKLGMLSRGVTLTPSFRSWFSKQGDFVRRRNVYNTPNWDGEVSSVIPQEISIGELTVAVNCYGDSYWSIDIIDEQPVLIRQGGEDVFEIGMISDLGILKNNPQLASLCNLYGGSALSFFSPRACYFFADNKECAFCSLQGTAKDSTGFASRIRPEEIEKATETVILENGEQITQIMIVGGNERDLDQGFRRQIGLAVAAQRALQRCGRDHKISIHVAAMPPRDLNLISLCEDVENLHVMFNLEVWAEQSFAQLLPGKTSDYGRDKMIRALLRLVSVIGKYRAHSLLIAGLETPEMTLSGAQSLAEMDISPIVNIYHSDKHSRLGLGMRPTYANLTEVAIGLQEIYQRHPIQPYWRGCGRNAIDYEASQGLFSSTVPNYE